MIKNIFLILALLIGINIPVYSFDLVNPNSDFIHLPNTSPEVQEYTVKVAQKIINNFEMPNSDENLTTVISFKIDTKGNLIKYEIIQSSNNEDYDNRVISAIKKSSPYPTPPLVKNAVEFEVLLNMDLSIIKLIKMLSGELDFAPALPAPLAQPENFPQKPTGMKFVNPEDLEKLN